MTNVNSEIIEEQILPKLILVISPFQEPSNKLVKNPRFKDYCNSLEIKFIIANDERTKNILINVELHYLPFLIIDNKDEIQIIIGELKISRYLENLMNLVK